ncbi:glycosyltransferase family 4 protein [Ectobacillus ponti]|uniref:Glycosyltransferase family 4 protein n=1 Tax=Ectobacillus ponti TaxID=2961894 RepID=A0AA41X9N7_9BACI|nr:glycosyltransferase family 4 protein [Ectobacillus ponti]MCP8968858.1 glycosyltransferase family 4 protein [Ectobacillus ponti]
MEQGNQAKVLFQQRMQEAASFWFSLMPEESHHLIGTAMLMDGQIERGMALYSQLPPSLHRNCNVNSAYRLAGVDNACGQTGECRMDTSGGQPFRKKAAMFLAYLGNTGAVRMLLTHKRWLEEDGFQVDLFFPSVNREKLAYKLFGQDLIIQTYQTDADMPQIASEYDIAFAPHWDYLFPLYRNFRKVFYFTQGDYDVFSEDEQGIQTLQNFYLLPVHIFTVSRFLQQHVLRKQHRNPPIIPCGIDLDLFQPGEKFEQTTVLVVGNAGAKQKHIVDVLANVRVLQQRYDFQIVWINPSPQPNELNGITVVCNPDAQTLAAYFRKSHIFVSGSEIESFSLPPLEAMASGTAVVAADNGGILEYARHGENALLFELNNWSQMNQYIEFLLRDIEARTHLERSGIQTAAAFAMGKIRNRFLAYVERCLSVPFFTS